jgi:hypothetical protein
MMLYGAPIGPNMRRPARVASPKVVPYSNRPIPAQTLKRGGPCSLGIYRVPDSQTLRPLSAA